MTVDHVNEFYNQKAGLLKQCIQMSEEILSSLESDEDLVKILSQRETVILKLRILEESYDNEVKASCTPYQKIQINQMINLLLTMDRSAVQTISERQSKLLNEIRTHKKEKQISNYVLNSEIQNIKSIFDSKK